MRATLSQLSKPARSGKVPIIPIFVGGLLALVLAGGCKSPEPPRDAGRTYQNPVYAGDMPDPSVRKLGEYYYAFGTTGAGRLPDGRIFTLLRSRNLVDWEKLGGALVPPTNNPAFQYWAPEIAEHRGKYYLYYSMGGLHAGTGIVVDRLVDMTRLACDRHVVLRAAHDWTLYESNRWMEVYGKTFNWHTIEGPCVLKHDGRIYCVYSGANWQTQRYGLDFVAAPTPLGPFTGAGDSARVLHGVPGEVRGPGHNSIVTGPDGKTQYVLYHAWDKRMKRRQLCLDKLEWTPDGPRCTPTVTPQPMP